VRSPSADTAIIVLMESLIRECTERVFVDTGCGKNRHVVRLCDVDMSNEMKCALIGFHSFTGCDYNSSFFRKGKGTCWKMMVKFSTFQDAFATLGSTVMLTDKNFSVLEEYVCNLYGVKSRNVNEVRFKLFHQKYSRCNKIMDLSVLPPCRQVLFLHSSRANTVAYLWKSSNRPVVNARDVIGTGWYNNGVIQWIEE
jgi:hypothetical protein